MFNQKGNISKVKLQTSTLTGIPIWFMRQAGRYLPEYQAAMNPIKNFFDACYNPELVTELTLQPIKRFDLDAAIIFSDIMVLLDCMGFDIEFLRGHGPVISEERKHTCTTEECFQRLSPVFKGMSMVRQTLPPTKALIGFAGAPWTLLTYILGKDKNFARLRTALHLQDNYILNLLSEITEFTAQYLIRQIECGADLIQIFDSNSYVLPPYVFEEFIIKPTRKIVSAIRSVFPDVQIIGFPKGCGLSYLRYAQETGVSVTSFDYSIPVQWIRENFSTPVQGNLDPFLLAFDIEKAVDISLVILSNLGDRDFIFNLGHGILPQTPVDNVQRIVDLVKSHSPDRYFASRNS